MCRSRCLRLGLGRGEQESERHEAKCGDRAIPENIHIRQESCLAGQGLIDQALCCPLQGFGRVAEIGSLNAAASRRLSGFRALLDALVQASASATTAADAVKRMLEETKLVEVLKAEGTDEHS